MGSHRGKYEEQRVGVDKVKPWVEVAKKAAPVGYLSGFIPPSAWSLCNIIRLPFCSCRKPTDAQQKQILLPYRLFQFALQQRLLQSHG